MPNGSKQERSEIMVWAVPLLTYLLGTLVAGIWYAAKIDSRVTVLENQVMPAGTAATIEQDLSRLQEDFRETKEIMNKEIIHTVDRLLRKCEREGLLND